ncbi:MAG: type II toxin-antitoxin system RelE/ParE family toxin [Candidatus Omnitrophica bacterium]|nr:type II toxin-antitoxin system RelE/ParE family toxin [Candidatus Omnitrophota bacterium]
MYTICIFEDNRGKEPFTDWLKSLPISTKLRVMKRIYRLEQGNLGDYKRVGAGVFELRLFFDGGLRVYFGRDGDKIIVLLNGGDKSSQERDIEKALEYWRRRHERQDGSISNMG